MAELLSRVIHVQPLAEGDENPQAGRWWGRAVHALVLRVLDSQDPNLAAAVHDESELRPFTASSLMGRFQRDGHLNPQEVYWLRLTALRRDIAQHLEKAVLPGGDLAPGAQIELDYAHFKVVQQPQSSPTSSPWNALSSYAEIGAPYLMANQPPPHRLRLAFTSPTTFKSEGRHIPLPIPKLIFGSLLERWNTFAPVEFPPELRRYFEECLVISRYELRTQAVQLKQGGVRVGMVGWADCTTLNYDRYWMSLTATLARYAIYAGVGAGVTQGLGQSRWLERQDEI